MGTIVVIIIVVVILGVIAFNIIKVKAYTQSSIIDEETKERRRKLAEKFQKEAEEKEKIQKEEEKKEIAKYGCTCTKSIKWWFDASTYLIRVYEESKKILIMDEEYSFSDIIGVDYMDKVHQIRTATTTTNNANMVGRAVVGGLVGGGLGAAVGAVTAKQQTSYDNSEVHDYVVLINTKILSKPLIELRIANNLPQVNEVVATLNAVIANNK